MQQALTNRLDNLEILLCEQENTVEKLNEVITRQTQQIDLMEDTIELLKQQLKDLKQQMADTPAIVDEKPPHY